MTLLALALTAALAVDPDKAMVTGDFENASLTEIMNSLEIISQVPIELDEAARKKIGDPAKRTATIKFKNISMTAAAKLLFGPMGLEVKVVDAQKLLVTGTP